MSIKINNELSDFDKHMLEIMQNPIEKQKFIENCSVEGYAFYEEGDVLKGTYRAWVEKKEVKL